MRQRPQPSVAQLKARREQSDRRKIANQLARAIRLGRLTVSDGHVCELEGERKCFHCQRKGRVFWVSTWHPVTPGARIGFIKRTPFMCAVCLWQRFARPGERLHERNGKGVRAS